ncbi:MAG: MBL fold metallo-hydrolase [Melioribacteraceae bacterium]|nr:MBL fold metallo-hydrolase [Melioribacteraceae bacterium]
MPEISKTIGNENDTITITILYDNNPLIEGLQTDWGFACFIDTGKNKILFDTGDNGNILLSNMKKLHMDFQIIDTVFLSHFHHDHTGGLRKLLQFNPNVNVCFPQSFPAELVTLINESGAKPVPVSDFTEILPQIFSTGEIKAAIPEQSLVIRKGKDLIIITGCAHPGIVTILKKVKSEFPDEIIYLVLGGFHLHRFNEDEINDVIHEFSDMGVLNVAPTHCSGDNARSMFRDVFDADYEEAGVGKVFIIK